MPEAPIDENGDSSTRERYIGDPAWLLQDLIVDPVAQSQSIHFATQHQFYICSFLAHSGHAATGIG
jgi:hypothetical protein